MAIHRHNSFVLISANLDFSLQTTLTIGSASLVCPSVRNAIIRLNAQSALRAMSSSSIQLLSQLHIHASINAQMGTMLMLKMNARDVSITARHASTTILAKSAILGLSRLMIPCFAIQAPVHPVTTCNLQIALVVSQSVLLAAPAQHVILALSAIHLHLAGNAIQSVEMEAGMTMKNVMMEILKMTMAVQMNAS